MHIGEKSFKCQVCDYDSCRKGDLKKHMLSCLSNLDKNNLNLNKNNIK